MSTTSFGAGENLYRIGKAYGVSHTELARANGIQDASRLEVGQRIFVPGGKRPLPVDVITPEHAVSAPPQPSDLPQGAGVFIWPLMSGTLTSSFGPRGRSFHDGIDIGAPPGTVVRAARDGDVIYSDTLRGYGNVVIVQHRRGLCDGIRSQRGEPRRRRLESPSRSARRQSGPQRSYVGSELALRDPKGQRRPKPDLLPSQPDRSARQGQTNMTDAELKTYVRDICDFPKPGIVFKDITPLLASGGALQEVVDRIADRYRGAIDMVLGIESRGFIIGAAVAYRLGLGLALVRKPGKLPASNVRGSIRARVRFGHARDPSGRVRQQEPRLGRGRSAGDRRHGLGGDSARTSPRR